MYKPSPVLVIAVPLYGDEVHCHACNWLELLKGVVTSGMASCIVVLVASSLHEPNRLFSLSWPALNHDVSGVNVAWLGAFRGFPPARVFTTFVSVILTCKACTIA